MPDTPSSDVLERWRDYCECAAPSAMPPCFACTAALTIERLSAELETVTSLLREADRRIAWESMGLGNTFAERVEEALTASPQAD